MITFKETLGLLGPYVRSRLMEQVKAVALIISYLVIFQVVILGIPIANAAMIASGLALVVVGLAFFMEGLVLGLMPLGEIIGLQLPRKSGVVVILLFAFALGVGATFAEPAIGVLKAAGSSVKAWEAPLLFLLLNKNAGILVYAVGIGVGIAVAFGMLRFLYNWSLKPFIYVLVGLVSAMTVWGYLDPNLRNLTGLAWDCGAVTTGPVTVPLVLALGIGISRIVSSDDSQSGGFGVVTLASLFPILAVLLLGFFYNTQVPGVMAEEEFFAAKNREKAMTLFDSAEEYQGYALRRGSSAGQLAAFDGDEAAMLGTLRDAAGDPRKKVALFDGKVSLQDWALDRGTPAQRTAVFGSPAAAAAAQTKRGNSGQADVPLLSTALAALQAAFQAIIPLSVGMMLVLFFVLREKLPRVDEVILGVMFAMVGMTIFNLGIELGLSRIGGQVGSMLPASYTSIGIEAERSTINGFDDKLVYSAVAPDGEQKKFFFTNEQHEYKAVPYEAANHDAERGVYNYTPVRGPLFGGENGVLGIAVVLLFAFFMGYGATLAEPALNALGATVETITVGNFKKSLLMQAVALGVGAGLLLGVAKIIWNIPLAMLLVPPYVLLLIFSKLSTEEFVNIGWDSAGVTTGPITVPLVLAMGLGIGSQAGVVEGFGILAMASVCPILSVLSVGLLVTARLKRELREKESQETGQADSPAPGVRSAS